MDRLPEFTKLTTLLVDDEQLIRDSLRLAYVNKGRFIKVVSSAEKALRILEKVSFDIIISDLKLPGLNGLEFLKQVRISHPNAVTILISANGNDQVIENAYEIVRSKHCGQLWQCMSKSETAERSRLRRLQKRRARRQHENQIGAIKRQALNCHP
jgi:DNA-binding NtrC family response regulator